MWDYNFDIVTTLVSVSEFWNGRSILKGNCYLSQSSIFIQIRPWQCWRGHDSAYMSQYYATQFPPKNVNVTLPLLIFVFCIYWASVTDVITLPLLICLLYLLRFSYRCRHAAFINFYLLYLLRFSYRRRHAAFINFCPLYLLRFSYWCIFVSKKVVFPMRSCDRLGVGLERHFQFPPVTTNPFPFPSCDH